MPDLSLHSGPSFNNSSPYPSMKQFAMLLKYFIVGDMFTNLIHHW